MKENYDFSNCLAQNLTARRDKVGLHMQSIKKEREECSQYILCVSKIERGRKNRESVFSSRGIM